MDTLILKLVLTPALIGVASLVGRRWGPDVSGWLVGLPFTSGPVAFFLALSHGTGFAACVPTGTLVGTISQAGFCVAYAWPALRYHWLTALAAGCVVFGVATAVLRMVGLSAVQVFPFVILALIVGLVLMPRDSGERSVVSVVPPRWDLPARMVIATVFVLLLTGVAPMLGARLSGLLAPFPLYASVLTVFAHQQQGARVAIRVLRGLLVGLFAFGAFFLVVAVAIERTGIAAAFVMAIVTAVALQGVSLWVMRRSEC